MKERKAGKSVNGNRKSEIRGQNEVRDLRIAEIPEKPRRKKGNLVAECSAYSTVFDALFLLVLISLAGIVLMPSMQAENQYYAAGYTTSSELDAYLLESLLSCKLEDFEYGISPLEALNISIPQNSVVENSSHALFGKEQKHRTFADLVAEYLALSLTVSNNDSSVFLNPLAANYFSRDAEVLSAYLDQKTGGRFSYRFEAY